MSGRRPPADDEQPARPTQLPAEERPNAPQRPAQKPDEQPVEQDETIPGGKYTTADGETVNAEGEPIDERGNVKKPEQG